MSCVRLRTIVLVYNDVNAILLYQSNLFEKLRETPRVRARMQRGSLRGHLRDSWRYDEYGRLVEYIKYHAIRVNCEDDVNNLNGLTGIELKFFTDTLDRKTLNALMSRVQPVVCTLPLEDFKVDGITKENY